MIPSLTNFGSAMSRGGSVSLVDAAGQPVPILSALSVTSGTDYRNAGLRLTGLALLAGVVQPPRQNGSSAPSSPISSSWSCDQAFAMRRAPRRMQAPVGRGIAPDHRPPHLAQAAAGSPWIW
jgi:hypothetical protein